MAEALVFPRQNIAIDQYVSELGIYAAVFDPAPVSFAIGEHYKILWDGEPWNCQVYDGSAVIPGAVYVGDASAFNLTGNGEPFVLVVSAENVMLAISLNDAEPSQHNLAIYRVTGGEPEQEGIVLKDRNGNDVAYYGIETVTFDTTTEGKQQVFTKGEAVEGLEIVPDFSEGDIQLAVPNGGLVKSAVIRKPADLSPENVRAGKTIAGFIGELVPAPDNPYIEYTLNEAGEAITAKLYGFTAIPRGCFAYFNKLQTVDLSESPNITSIGESAFYGCSALPGFDIPTTVTSIGKQAFYGCVAFTSVVIPDSVTSIDTTNMFQGCSALTSVTLPAGTTSIGDYAFYNCTSLNGINIPESVTSIGAYAFYNCPLTNVSIPDGVLGIGGNAFWKCTKLESVTIGNGCTSIGTGAFNGCNALTNVTLGNAVRTIDGSAFNNCTKLTSITIPASVTKINYSAFSGCTALTSATFKTTSGWRVSTSSSATSGTSIGSSYLANTSTAATYLRSTYANYYWRRS